MEDHLRFGVMHDMRKKKLEGLLDAVKDGEGQSVEFKARFTTVVGKSICAFANTTGGLYF